MLSLACANLKMFSQFQPLSHISTLVTPNQSAVTGCKLALTFSAMFLK
jgi:hypothetical protein